MVDNYERIPRKSDTSYVGGQTPAVWQINSGSTIKIFSRKVFGKNCKDLLAGYAVNGPATTYSIGKFIVEREQQILEKKHKKIKSISNKIRSKASEFSRLVRGREDVKKESDLVSQGYLFKIKDSKNEIYFLTLKGSIICLGFSFSDKELQLFINNAAKYHLFFAFLNILLINGISLPTLKRLFVYPIMQGFATNKIPSDTDLQFYFGNLGFLCGRALWQVIVDTRIKEAKFLDERRKAHKRLKNFSGIPEMKELENFINTYVKLLPRIRGKAILSNLTELYGVDSQWRSKVIRKLYGKKTHPYEFFEDNSEEYQLLLYILLHVDIAIHYGFEYAI